MHLLVIIVFGMAIWRPPEGPISPVLTNPVASIAFAALLPLTGWLAARRSAARALRRLSAASRNVDAAQVTYHRSSIALRFTAFVAFAAAFYLTRWPEIVARLEWAPRWSAMIELFTVAPFFLTILAIWHGLFPADRALREYVVRSRQWEHVPSGRVWSLGEYLAFNARHQLLTVAVPMSIILVAWSACDHFRRPLVRALHVPWAPDAMLALVAIAVFLFSPLLLKTIWSTEPLPQGPLRRRLELACRRAGLRCRDILVWRSHGMMINAAVMGLLPRVRYVLLSDALLEGLDEDGIEAVFGHEAGHIRHRHIQYFLLFALVSVLIVSGVMEILLRLSIGRDATLALNDWAIQGIGLLCVAILWGTAFGWISRRFERQADVFGALVASPPHDACLEPCGVHFGTREQGTGNREQDIAPSSSRGHDDAPLAVHHPRLTHAICASGAKTFVSALDRVAVLNGIPHEEPSWRHSSIGSRMRFLTALSGDPALAAAFHRRIAGIKRTLWFCAVTGLAIGAGYTWWHPDYRALIYQSTVAPLKRQESKPQHSNSKRPPDSRRRKTPQKRK